MTDEAAVAASHHWGSVCAARCVFGSSGLCVDASVCVWAGEVESGSIFILYESVCVCFQKVCV